MECRDRSVVSLLFIVHVFLCQFLATASNWNDPILYTRCIVFSYIEEEEEEEEEKM